MTAKEGYIAQCYVDVQALESPFLQTLDVRGMPTYVLLDDKGVVIEKYTSTVVKELFSKLGSLFY